MGNPQDTQSEGVDSFEDVDSWLARTTGTPAGNLPKRRGRPPKNPASVTGAITRGSEAGGITYVKASSRASQPPAHGGKGHYGGSPAKAQSEPLEDLRQQQALQTLAAHWREQVAAYHQRMGLRLIAPNVGRAEREHILELMRLYAGAGDLAETVNTIKAAMEYLCTYWARICPRFTRTVGVTPTISLLARFHETLVAEGVVYAQTRAAIERYQGLVAAPASHVAQDLGCVYFPGDRTAYLEQRQNLPADVVYAYRQALALRAKFTAASWDEGALL